MMSSVWKAITFSVSGHQKTVDFWTFAGRAAAAWRSFRRTCFRERYPRYEGPSGDPVKGAESMSRRHAGALQRSRETRNRRIAERGADHPKTLWIDVVAEKRLYRKVTRRPCPVPSVRPNRGPGWRHLRPRRRR